VPRARLRTSSVVLFCLVLLLAGCAAREVTPPPGRPPSGRLPASQRPYTVDGRTYYPIPSAYGYREEGLASWYGEPFHGRKTASGETYNMYALTAAHRTLPLGTQVRVTGRRDGRRITVRVNDRGPFVQGRIIDLSFAAAKEMGLVGPGTAPVVVEAVGQPAPAGGAEPPPFHLGPLTVQIGAFTNPANATRLANELNDRYGPNSASISRFDDGSRVFHRVRIFNCPTRASAEEKLYLLERDGYGLGFVVAQD